VAVNCSIARDRAAAKALSLVVVVLDVLCFALQTGDTELEDESQILLLAATAVVAGGTGEAQNSPGERRAEQWTDKVDAQSLVHRVPGNRQCK